MVATFERASFLPFVAGVCCFARQSRSQIRRHFDSQIRRHLDSRIRRHFDKQDSSPQFPYKRNPHWSQISCWRVSDHKCSLVFSVSMHVRYQFRDLWELTPLLPVASAMFLRARTLFGFLSSAAHLGMECRMDEDEMNEVQTFEMCS